MRGDLIKMLFDQTQQQRTLYGLDWISERKRDQLAMEFGSHLVGSVHDYMTSRGFKHRVGANAPQREANRLDAFTDILKWALAIAASEEWEGPEIAQAFLRKTEVVYARHKAVPPEDWLQPVASLDLDGVLVEFDRDNHQAWDADFIERDGPAHLPPHHPGFDLVDELANEGWGYIITTSRKIDIYPELEWQTYSWLKRNGLEPLMVVFTRDKNEALNALGKGVKFHIDDSLKHAIDVGDSRPSFYYNQAPSGGVNYPSGVTLVTHPSQINLDDVADDPRLR